MEKLTSFDRDLLLQVLRHYMPQDVRRKVMEALPLQYNRWMEAEIMVVGQRPAPREEGAIEMVIPVGS